MTINVQQIAVNWRDGYENWPDLTMLLDREPDWQIYEKRPCSQEALSAEQEAIIGGKPRPAPPGWHVYWSEDDGFVWFFTWGGKPDDGFGGRQRTVTLSDGTTEEVIGGWHTSGNVAVSVGLPAVVDIGTRTSLVAGRLAGGMACFITEERFCHEVEAHLPDVEVCRHPSNGVLTVKWRGQPSKAEFMAAEYERRDKIREGLKAKYHDDTWHGGDWYRRSTQAERASLDTRPYSALGPATVVS